MNLYGFAAGDPVSYSDPFGLCPTPDGGDDGKPCPSPIAQMMEQFNQGLKDAVASVAEAALQVGAGIANAVTGLGDYFTAWGLNPNVQSAGGRTLAGASFAAGMMMTPEGAIGAHIGIEEGKAALATLMGGDFKVIGGAGSGSTFRAAGGLAGNAADWQYVTSKAVLEINGFKWQAHYARNIVTGETAMAKLKAVGFVK